MSRSMLKKMGNHRLILICITRNIRVGSKVVITVGEDIFAVPAMFIWLDDKVICFELPYGAMDLFSFVW